MLTTNLLRAAAAGIGLVSLASAQNSAPPPKPVGPDDVVATVEGEKITAGMLQRLRNGASQEFRQAARQNNRDFLKSVAGLLVLSKLAEQEKIADQAPYKDQLAFLRMNFLANAYIANMNSKFKVSQEEIQAHYEKNKADYEAAAVRAIYIAYSQSGGTDSQGKKRLTEPEAKAKAERLVAELKKKGADFATLAKENSDDASTAEKGGDIGTIKRTSSGIPAEIRQVVFALKPGEISEPVPQPAGFYIFKLEKLLTTPFEEIAGTIATNLQAAKVQTELSRILSSMKIKYENEGFFNEGAASDPRPPAPGP